MVQEVDRLEIKINKILEDIIPKLKEEEYQKLKESIGKKGLLQPLDLMDDGTVIDGHHRFRACMELKMDKIPYKVLSNIKTIDDAIEYSFEINFRRRHLNVFQKAEWVYKAEYAKTKRKPGTRTDLTGDESSPVGKTSELLSEKVGVSKQTMERAIKIMDVAPEEIKQKLRDGNWSLNYAYDGYNAVDKVEDEGKKKELTKAFEKEELNPIQLEDIFKKGHLAQELIESRAPKDKREEMTSKYEEKMYTLDLDIRKLEEDLKEVGGLAELKEVEVDQEIIKSKSDAEKFAKQCGGFLIGETRYWKMKVDPYKYQKASEV